MQTLKNIKNQLGNGGFLFVASLIVNLGNYGLNVVLARWLGPDWFAEANILATIIMVLSFLAMGVQLVITKFIAEYKAKEEREEMESFIYFIKSRITILACFASLFLILSSMWISQFFHFSSCWPFIILFVGVPSYLLLSLARGVYQGKGQFNNLAKTYLIEMVSRVVFTIILLLIFNDLERSSEIVAIGFLVSFILSHLIHKVDSIQLTLISVSTKSRIFKVFSIICFYELSQILINNSDVILVKHFFDNYESGLYASIALLGRAVFFATWIIVTMLFPKVIEKEKKGESHTRLFWSALGIVFLFGVVMVAACFLFGEVIMLMAFGESYNGVSNLLWIYALSTSLFALANVFVYYFMSLEKYLPVYFSIAAGALQIFMISLFHMDLEIVVRVQVVIMSLLLSAMMVFYKYHTSPQHAFFLKYQNQSKL